MKTLYVMDPLETLHLEGDSTYMMMLESIDEDGLPIGVNQQIYLQKVILHTPTCEK